MGFESEVVSEPPVVRASVIIKGVETQYGRIGAGRPVLLLAEDAGVRSTAAAGLARAVRVIVPEPGGETPGCDLLRGLLDGLGLEEVGIVADEALAVAALGLALADPWRIRHLALVVRSNRGRLLPPDGIEAALGSSGQRLVMLRTDGAPDWVDRIAGFMGGEPSAS